jgi:hypothetical protein
LRRRFSAAANEQETATRLGPFAKHEAEDLLDWLEFNGYKNWELELVDGKFVITVPEQSPRPQ